MAIPDSLTTAARVLADKVAELNREAADREAVLTRQLARQRTIVRLLVGVVACMLALAGAVGVALNGVANNTERLNASATVNRQKALCPLYELLLASNTTASRARAADKAAYDRSFKVIGDGYAALNCAEFKGDSPVLGSGD
ncbi:hypothetical protein [Streptomyces sp. SID3212]|uniref:hypothetical protein n=1 Tax=Streptomyces sp. SID3212 TaxID=2690259 RepID=UPI00136F1CC3|nr:hypothetical protein [Streptomyces sp. SID3212]MYV58049.1 hypothetical protein [Streptomyces sp. SID3212]